MKYLLYVISLFSFIASIMSLVMNNNVFNKSKEMERNYE